MGGSPPRHSHHGIGNCLSRYIWSKSDLIPLTILGGWVGKPVLGHVHRHVLRHVRGRHVRGRHMPEYMLEHMPGHVPDRHVPQHVLKHVPHHVLMHMPDKHVVEHVSRQVPKHVLNQMAHAVLRT